MTNKELVSYNRKKTNNSIGKWTSQEQEQEGQNKNLDW